MRSSKELEEIDPAKLKKFLGLFGGLVPCPFCLARGKHQIMIKNPIDSTWYCVPCKVKVMLESAIDVLLALQGEESQ